MFIKKYFVSTIFLGVSVTAFSQDTVWISKKGTIIPSKDSADRYNVVYRSMADTQYVKVIRYLNDGAMLDETNYFPYNPKRIFHGVYRKYNDGNLVEERMYANNEQNGQHQTYWENGKLKRNDLYKNGKFISGKCYGIDGADTAWFAFEKSARFPGGNDSLRRYIAKYISYPSLVKLERIEGTVKIKFTITKDGSLEDIQVINSVHDLLDAAALRLVRQMPKWEPASQDGRFVKMYFILPVVFQLKE